MTKAELVSHVAAETATTRTAAERMVGTVCSAIADALARDEPVAIAGFRRFAARARAATEERGGKRSRTTSAFGSLTPSDTNTTRYRPRSRPPRSLTTRCGSMAA